MENPMRRLFFVGRRLRCCSNPPLRRFTNFQIKQKLQCHYNTGVLGGRGWITQAAHLKRPRRGLFAAGTYGGGPYELRLPIFLQPLGGALKNRSAAPASPPCFRRRRTGCGTQHPLRLACVSLAAAPNNSSLLPPLAALVVVAVGSAAVRIHPWICFEKFRTKEKLQHLHDAGVFGGRGWIRTTEAEKQQIYSLSPLATREHAHILFVSVAGRLAYFIIGFWICQPLFFISFLFLSIQ